MLQDKLHVFCWPFYLTFKPHSSLQILKGIVGKSSCFHKTWYLHDVVVVQRNARQRNARATHFFVQFFAVVARPHFVKNVNARQRFSFSCSELGYSPLERNSRKNLEKMRKLSNLPKNWRCFNFITISRSI